MRCPSATMRSFNGRRAGLRGLGARPARSPVPQLLEVVVRAYSGLHHVDHDVAAVDEYPVARFLAFEADHLPAGFLHPVTNVVSQRLDLPVRLGSGDDQVIAIGG